MMADYNKNVFINCPYDKEYKGLLDATLFVIIALGYNPRLAKETSDSGENRIDKIVRIIQECRYSIHDLSRVVSSRSGEFFRLNMPLELGIDYGCRKLIPNFSDKKFLILEKEKYTFQKAISDLSGIDVKEHGNNGAKIVECIRDWFAETVRVQEVPSADRIFADYTDDFQVNLLEYAEKLGFKKTNYIDKITTYEYINFIDKWKLNKPLYNSVITMPDKQERKSVNIDKDLLNKDSSLRSD